MSSQKSRKPRRRSPPPQPADQPSHDRVVLEGRTITIAASIVLIAVVALVAYVRLRMADVPLERDEGEYAYAGQLILGGIPPYELAYNMKFPGTYYAYAALMAIFGQTPWGIRAGLLCVHLSTIGLLFLVGRRLAGTLAGAVGAAAFALLAVDRWSMGLFAHATHFVALPALGGILVLLHAIRNGRAWSFATAGVLMGVAVIMKQHAASFAVMAIGLAAWSAGPAGTGGWREPLRRAGLTAAGVGVSLAALAGWLAVEGVLGRFWFWTYEYAATYVSQVPVSAAGDNLALSWRYITQANASIWYGGLAGLVLLFVTRWTREIRVVLLVWVAAAALAVVPGFYFRQHYFIVLMPAAGILAGIAVTGIARLLTRVVGATAAPVLALACFVMIAGLYVQRDAHYLLSMRPVELFRSLYATNPFLESPEIARYIKAHTTPDDRIVVLGSEPQIFFYAGRRSATGYMYAYPLMENQPFAGRMQEEFRREVENARPRYLIFVGVPMSWGTRPESDTRVLTWANEFAGRCYDRVGIVDIDPAGEARVRWDAESRNYQPQFASQVWTLRRKDGGDCGSLESGRAPGG